MGSFVIELLLEGIKLPLLLQSPRRAREIAC